MDRLLPSNELILPRAGLTRAALRCLTGSRAAAQARRSVLGRLPFPALASEVRDVVYLTWMVPPASVRHLVPPGVDLWERGRVTPLTILNYRHGHLGPACAGPLRRVLPSPLQSNWRLYVGRLHETEPSERAVLFIKNVFSTALHAAGARLVSDILPAHVPLSFRHERDGATYSTEIDGGGGSAPSFRCCCERSSQRSLTPEMAPHFASWPEAVRWLCSQDYAIVPIDNDPRLAESRIDLPIDFSQVEPLRLVPGSFGCEALRPVVGQQVPFCFLVPRVRFRVLSQRLIEPAPR